MKLSIITINYNNAEGLRKTLASVASQTFRDVEHIIVDGGSTDGSVEIIEAYASDVARKASSSVPTGGDGCYAAVYSQDSTSAEDAQPLAQQDTTSPKATQPYKVRWLSEPDSGIYNAMNKGIKMASGEYLLFLNSGDCLVDKYTLLNVLAYNLDADIVYGNCIQVWLDGTMKKVDYPHYVTGKTLFNGTLPHQASFIRKRLFDIIGNYSECYKIVSDWEFYLKALFLHNCSFKFIDIYVCLFDMHGISNSDEYMSILGRERNDVFKKYIPLLYEDYMELNHITSLINSRTYKVIVLTKKLLYPLIKMWRRIKSNQ